MFLFLPFIKRQIKRKMRLKISDWCVSGTTIKFKDETLCNCPNSQAIKQECPDCTEIVYNTEELEYYITCTNKKHRQIVTALIADRIEEYVCVKKIIIKDKETDCVLTITVSKSIDYKRRFG